MGREWERKGRGTNRKGRGGSGEERERGGGEKVTKERKREEGEREREREGRRELSTYMYHSIYRIFVTIKNNATTHVHTPWSSCPDEREWHDV